MTAGILDDFSIKRVWKVTFGLWYSNSMPVVQTGRIQYLYFYFLTNITEAFH